MSPSLSCGLLSVIQMEMVLVAVSIIKAAGDAEPAGDAELPAPASVRQRLHRLKPCPIWQCLLGFAQFTLLFSRQFWFKKYSNCRRECCDTKER